MSLSNLPPKISIEYFIDLKNISNQSSVFIENLQLFGYLFGS